MIGLELLGDIGALRALVPSWLALTVAALEANPFYHPGFLLPLVEELGWPPGLVVAVARHRDDELAGVFPLVRSRTGPSSLLPVLRSAFNPMPVHGLLATPLLHRERAAAALDALLDRLDHGALPAPTIELLGHTTRGPFGRLLDERLRARRQPAASFTGISRPLLRPRRSAEAYLEEALSSRHRRELGRQRRKLESRGPLRLVRSRGEAELERWVERFLVLEAAGWKGRTGTALASDPRERRFFERACRELARCGAIRFHALELDGQPIAMACLLCEAAVGGGGFVFKIAFDERFRQQSPGMQLLIEQLRALHDDDELGWIDSCASPKDTFYRQLWLDRRELGHLLIAPRSWLGRSVVFAARELRRWRARRAPAPAVEPG